MTSRFLKRMSVRHQVGSSATFNADRDLRVDIAIERGGLRDASASGFQRKRVLQQLKSPTRKQGFTCVAEVLTKMDQLLHSTSEARKRNHYTRVGRVSFDERSRKLVTFAVERFGRLGMKASEFIDQMSTRVVEERGGGAMTKRGICK